MSFDEYGSSISQKMLFPIFYPAANKKYFLNCVIVVYSKNCYLQFKSFVRITDSSLVPKFVIIHFNTKKYVSTSSRANVTDQTEMTVHIFYHARLISSKPLESIELI